MTEQSTPEPTDYPSSWKPSYIKEREQQRDEFEERVARLSDVEIQRIRRGV